MHFFPKSPEVVEKLNRFVGKHRNWIPADMEEANADFKKQYDKGETFTAEYLQKANNSSRFGSSDHVAPSYRLLQQLRGQDEGEGNSSLDRLDAAIDAVHEEHGLHCGAALTTTAPLKAIGMGPTASATNQPNVIQEQLLLLAA